MTAPVHPVAQLQGPFDESMLESAHDDSDTDVFLDAVTRRNTLLEAPTYTRVVAGRWKQKPGEQYHPLWKLIAQISFGVHLLAEGMAKSEDDVMQILQAHVDEIDGFLERTTEDFDLAAEDIQERLKCLKLPLSHPATFDKMLEDRNFRLSIIEGNEKIEHIVDRTALATKDSMKDVQKGFDSTSCLQTYLQGLSITWHRASIEHEAVYVAMLGNVEGWRKAFLSLHMQGDKLGGSLRKLTDIINEMQARAGEVSRRLLHQAKVQHPVPGLSTGRNTPTSKYQDMPSKQLPGMPNRPPLRPTLSNATPPLRTSSQEALRQQTMLGRSQTPQYGKPEPLLPGATVDRRAKQVDIQSQSRMQSLSPSPNDDLRSSQNSLSRLKMQITEEEQPERYFPPVELPAHVPQETMRQAPMSKQNRLSMGLGLIPNKGRGRHEKRNSKLGASALIDLLRTNPIVNKLSDPPKTRTLTPSQSSNTVEDSSAGLRPTIKTPPLPRSVSTTGVTMHTKTNIRRPKKGTQHWFDALEDDLKEDDKFPIAEEPPTITQTITIRSTPKAYFEQDTEPGTPGWAVTSFASAPNRREILKKGAFCSHPPDVPLGSPPLTQSNTMPNLMATMAQQRRPSHSSSAGHSTLGEPGPEIAASEVSSASKHSSHLVPISNNMKRASAYAPEVVMPERTSSMPPPARQFVAEMEGSSPAHFTAQTPSSTKGIVMELEAPLSAPHPHFILPPRSQASGPASPNLIHEARQPHFILPPRPQQTVSETVQPKIDTGGIGSKTDNDAAAERDEVDSVEAVPVLIGLEEDSEIPRRTGMQMTMSENATDEIESDIAKSEENSSHREANEEGLPSSVFIPTPDHMSRVSSPDINSKDLEIEERAKPSAKPQTLFLLPALTYQAPGISPPISPQFVSPDFHRASDPALSRPHSAVAREDVAETTRSVVEEPTQPTHTSTSQIASTTSLPKRASPPEEYDPFRAGDEVLKSPQIVRLNAAKVISITTKTKAESINRENKPAELKHTRNVASHGSHNGWKAFFTGQPSPAGSNLSIRSIRQESIEDQPAHRSSGLLTPASVTGRYPLPPSPATSSAKDVVWFSKPFDEQMQGGKHGSEASTQPKEAVGLGIKASY